MLSEKIKSLELLSPARDLECGFAAINHGADAVYIGSDRFGARKQAGNSLGDIQKLTEYAHLFGVKIYVTINTLLFNEELKAAETLINELYKIKVDAIIVQDMGILEMNLPPIPLHASTQTDNRTPEKVKFLEDAGFRQVVLARELTLDQIRDIKAKTSVPLEFFVHGALCVCYSGKCYMSHQTTGRSANRGECSQPCRLPYTLTTPQGNVLINNQHILSLKDLNLSNSLQQLIDAGITSFKIEGRLKDAGYVKNITTYYRQKLDEIIDSDDHLKRASSGITHPLFAASPEKSFSRGFTSYFINGRQHSIWSPHSPKSMGEKLGKVIKTGADYFIPEKGISVNNGDGLCFLTKKGELKGFRVNRTTGNKIEADDTNQLYAGATLFRNHDQAFDRQLNKSEGQRKITISLHFTETDKGVKLSVTDEDKITTVIEKALKKELAQKPVKALEQIQNQLSKWGNTIFKPINIRVDLSQSLFITAGFINQMRRNLCDLHQQNRMKQYRQETAELLPTNHPYPYKLDDYSSNITNTLSEEFYRHHQVEKMAMGLELQPANGEIKVMTTRHCIRHANNLCPRENKDVKSTPLIMSRGDQTFELRFDCAKCEMEIWKKS
ncbi:peptidase U32 family protein [Geofilum sp. OHC36d9]|uniref:peptidase U32 family protein n=1 Tax=Geofilum sp. OHC36d9 TaxID=3458413 RepID=UPI0040345E18